MNTRAGDIQQQLQETAASLQTAEETHRDIAKQLTEAERGLTEIITALDHLRGENEQRRAAYMQQMRQAAALGNETSALESQATSTAETRERCRARMVELDRMLDALQQELDVLRSRRIELTQQTEEHVAWLSDAKERLAQHQKQQAAAQEELSELRRRHSGAAERAAVLEELVRRQEGLSTGVKEVLSRAANAADPVFRCVCGIAADLFKVSVEAAPLVEIALGQAAQHIVATPSVELLDHLQKEANRLGGRVGFLWLDAKANISTTAEEDLEGRPGILGRADRFVETDARFLPLVRRLLGRTWFVEKLSQAMQLARISGNSLSFVTLAGELLESDGTLTVGPRNATSGLISRRSQLRALQTQLAELQTAIDAAQVSIAANGEQLIARQQHIDARSVEYQQAAEALAGNRAAISAAEDRRVQTDQQRASLETELREADAQHAAALQRLAEAQEKRKQIEAGLGEMERALAQLGQQIDQLESRRVAAGRETTEIKVDLAKCEERLRNYLARMKQFEENRQERHHAIDEARERLDECIQRDEASRFAILRAEGEIAELYLSKETYASRTVGFINRREELTAQRAASASEVQKIHGRIRKVEEKIHAAELATNEVLHERNTLADRMREDYGIDLAALEPTATDEEQQQRETVQQEIEELRQKINGIGSVNLESLDELEQLETRHKTIADQLADLTSAKTSLDKIIDRINTDSRRLFSETLETVKEHFQTLFRDLFGGGHADILLEENVDILDSGIEIIARPPGKVPRSISLLSGGEKTMTCVALLLAIFRSRPSPFCVLDEVDAALDEANIDRFTKVIQGFLTWTQFIIVTHSKKTMTCATTIYGVTMQESGVSKQVSVRFEDVSDDGHIITRPAEEKGETQAA
jgi:chromosome segregation protein